VWQLPVYPPFAGISLAAGSGFEPGLTDPELRSGCFGPY
jgi:hypothetical protein